jgi:hypothetical protein
MFFYRKEKKKERISFLKQKLKILIAENIFDLTH